MFECSGSPCSTEEQLDHLRQVVRACAIHQPRLDLNSHGSSSWLTQDCVLLWRPLVLDRAAVHSVPHLAHRVPW